MCLSVCLRLAALVKDYCGSVSEKSVQMNFALIYELLDEMVVSQSEWSALRCDDRKDME